MEHRRDDDVIDNAGDGFRRIAYKIVIVERRGMARHLANLLEMSYGAFYNRLVGRAEFTPHQINVLYRELGDIRLAECLFVGTKFRAMRTDGSKEPIKKR
jgi:hypothetical protein